MNLLLHGVDAPDVRFDNSLKVRLGEIGESERVSVILTNPPFGGEEEPSIQNGFPPDKRTSETALLFLQLIMRKLHRAPTPGRAAVVVPNGILFADGVAARIKEELLKEFRLHTIVRLPAGVFAPYTSIHTNLLFFEAGAATTEIWYYEQPLPEGRKSYSKTQPMQYEEFAPLLAWWNEREENERAWRVDWTHTYETARAAAQLHWDAALDADAKAREYGTTAKSAAERVQTAQRLSQSGMLSEDERTSTLVEIDTQRDRRDQAQENERGHRERSREEQSRGDTLYWPIYNLDRKNPSRADDFEHLPAEQLIGDILDKERQIIALMQQIEQTLAAGVSA
jgi:type I restriction enzyme M protein